MNVGTHTGQRTVEITVDRVRLEGILGAADRPAGAVLFAHGSGSGRLSPRNNYVAQELQRAGLATLLVDLLTEEEALSRSLVFDIDLLAGRVRGCTEWLRREPATKDLALGYFGASTGAGAALVAAAQEGDAIKAVVSRGGRPDLAGEALGQVTAPTLLIVGGNDAPVIRLNEQARAMMAAPTELAIVSGASHLFEEPGTLEEVARLASGWFVRHLRVDGAAS